MPYLHLTSQLLVPALLIRHVEMVTSAAGVELGGQGRIRGSLSSDRRSERIDLGLTLAERGGGMQEWPSFGAQVDSKAGAVLHWYKMSAGWVKCV